MKPTIVLDTNIILLDANNLLTLGQDYDVVLPETVLDELDVKKTSPDPTLRFQARQFGRLFTSLSVQDVERTSTHTIITRSIDDITVKTISLAEYPNTFDSDVSIRNDRKILAATKHLIDLGTSLTFISNDVMCRERAIAMGIDTRDFKLVEESNLEFTKHLSVSSEDFSRLHNLSIASVDPEYVTANYNYVFTDSLTGQTKLGNIRNGSIDILGKDTEAELRRQDATPMNSGQLFLSRAIQNPHVDIVVCEALAGSGKTVTAFSNAIRLVKKGEYGGITYIRASVDDVDKAEEIGFLSGNEEKLAVYLHPVHDTLDFIARNRYKDSKLKGKEYEEFIAKQIDEMTEKYNISSMIGLGMRGRTFSNTIAIIDEAQNMSKSSLQKVLTRFGKNCKIIIIGSNKQIDNPYITKYTNGLSVLLDACTNEQDSIRLHAVPLEKVLRSNIAEFAETTFSRNAK